MKYIYCSSEEAVKECLNQQEPLIVAIAFDESETIIGTLEEVHHGTINVLQKDKNFIRSRLHRLYAPQKESCYALQ